MTISICPTQETLDYFSNYLTYNSETGIVFRHFKFEIKEVNGWSTRNYKRIRVFKKEYQLHNVIWFLHYGKWPDREIDHKDQNTTNNKITNLKLSTRTEQANNTPLNNLEKYIYFYRGKYSVIIPCNEELNRKRIYLGRFSEMHKAVEVRDKYLRDFNA